jgi:hypothetical protein
MSAGDDVVLRDQPDTGAATASLPAALTRASRNRALADLARRRVGIDRDRKSKARLGFPAAWPRLATFVPSETKSSAMAAPIPLVPPLITGTLFSSACIH